jgi:acyl-CoA thioesterase I
MSFRKTIKRLETLVIYGKDYYFLWMPQTPKSSRARRACRALVLFAFPAALAAIFVYEARTSLFADALSSGIGKTAGEQRDGAQVILPRLAARFRQSHGLTVVAFGSSSTQGVGASSPAHAYPALLEADLRRMLGGAATVKVVNRGIGGEDADDMLARLSKDVLPQKPDLVIWQTGTNDPLRKVPLERFIDETREGVRQMRAAGIEVMLMEPQDCRVMRRTPGANGYRDAVRAVGNEMGVPVIRRSDLMKAWLAEGMLTETQLMSPDGLHMADQGYERLAGEVAREVMADAGLKSELETKAALH